MKTSITDFSEKDLKITKNLPKIYRKAYDVWRAMISRCYLVDSKNYKYYGGKGITVCEGWKTFSNFLFWFLNNYEEGLSLDKDSKNDFSNQYNEKNCSFITKAANTREMTNRRNYDDIRGSNNFRAKNKNFYKKNSCQRANFKKICRRQNWDFDNFEEIKTEKINCRGARYYFYKEKGVLENV
ncbi:MAG: hypothetical protein ACRC0G_13810 [Fusobacteriaceae bacterium]